MPNRLSEGAGAASPSVSVVAVAGLIALAVAMGIGRFAFTPILPMMQVDIGLTLAAAGWLAAANYLGYLIGALCAARLSIAWAVRGGLLLIALVTFGMGIVHVFAAWLALRLLAGIASAWVLVHVSAWALEHLLALRRPDTNGIVYAGVGVGVAGTGLLCMLMMRTRADSDHAWEWLGAVALLFTAIIWSTFRAGAPRAAEPAAVPTQRVHWDTDKWRLMLCYGALGFGYIIPATFLPAMARQYITDPAVFGWAWPLFGAASALSTWIAARWLGHFDDRRLWAICYVLMMAGVALPALWPTLLAILIAALLVGGTYMVVTMLGLREARRAAGSEATSFIAVMTAAFALGQILGPLLVSAVAGIPYGLNAALLVAALVLLLAAITLWRSAP